MSKYRLIVYPSKLSLVCSLGWYGILIASLIQWQPNAFSYQIQLQIALAVSLMALALKNIVIGMGKKNEQYVSLSSSGDWQPIRPGESINYRISNASLFASWGVWLKLTPLPPLKGNRWQLFFRDQFCQRDFRRLCRVVNRRRQSPDKQSGDPE